MDKIPGVRHKLITGKTTYAFAVGATDEIDSDAVGIIGFAVQNGALSLAYGTTGGRIADCVADAHVFFPFPLPLIS